MREVDCYIFVKDILQVRCRQLFDVAFGDKVFKKRECAGLISGLIAALGENGEQPVIERVEGCAD